MKTGVKSMDEEIKKASITIQSYIQQITTPSASQYKLEIRKQQYESAKEKFDSLMKDNAELAKEIIIKQVGNFHFYRLIKDRNLPQSWIDERRNLQKEIVKNPDKFSLQQIQNAVCDLYFRDSVKNTSINIRTLEDREGTQGNEIYNEKLAKYKDLFDATLKFITLTDATPEEVQRNLDQIIQLAQPLMQQGPIFQAVRDLLDLEERDFIAELSAYIAVSKQTMLDGIEPEIIKTEDNNTVKFFTLKNQTKAQSSFQMLVHNMNIQDWMYKPEAMEEYVNAIKSQYLCCYSLIDQSINNAFCQRHNVTRITFGYLPDNLENMDMAACRTRDAQTNQFTFLKNITGYKQDFYSIPEFLRKIDSYSELAFRNESAVPKPDYIVIQSEEPSDKVVKIASAMQIPIIYIDPNAYEKYPEPEKSSTGYSYNEYAYFDYFLKENLSSLDLNKDKTIE